jgi:hypothetical protein
MISAHPLVARPDVTEPTTPRARVPGQIDPHDAYGSLLTTTVLEPPAPGIALLVLAVPRTVAALSPCL